MIVYDEDGACIVFLTLNRVGLDYSYNRYSSNNVDMISIITELWDTSNFNYVKENVLAHHDDLNMPLNMLEILNCRIDSLAKDIA